MVDIEALGNQHRAAIISIAAVTFDEDGPSDNVFYQKIEWCDALKHGEMTPSALKWWMKQSDDARNAVLDGTLPLKRVMRSFQKWFPESGRIWGNGPTSDVVWLEHACRQVDVRIPWHYRNVRDVRTIVDLTRNYINTDDFKEESDVPHDALSDAKYQARYVGAMLKLVRERLKGVETDYFSQDPCP
jgi:oligoribonuclease (3'-5' exoribonuclease)